jgi:hypothetical protein
MESAGAEMDFTRKRVLAYGSRKDESAKRAWVLDPKTWDSGHRRFCKSKGARFGKRPPQKNEDERRRDNPPLDKSKSKTDRGALL